MVRLNLLAALAITAVTTVNAGPDTGNWGKACRTNYGGGRKWTDGDVGRVLQDFRNACYGWSGNRGAYQDLYFKPWNQSPYTAAICVNQPGGWKVNIEIGNLNPNTGFVLRPDDCYKELKSLTAGYSFWGAEEQQYGWYFRADPNDGSC